MANILFKRGAHANLPSGAQVIDGAFYLTTDTHRLYTGIGQKLVDLNQYIQVVSTTAELNDILVEEGDFAYVQTGNILAIRQGDGWVQINKNDNTVTNAVRVTNKKVAAQGGAETDPQENRLTIAVGDSAGNYHSDEVIFVGEGGTDIKVDADGKITITGCTYALNTQLTGTSSEGTFTIGLNASDDTYDSQFQLHTGANIEFVSDGANGITIKATDTVLAAGGHSFETNANGGASIKILDSSTNEAVATAPNGSFFYKVGTGANQISVNNKGELPVYTTGEIDKMFNDLNPMKYIGPVYTYDELIAKTNVKIGDTYMVSGNSFELEDFNGSEEKARTGDLFIATIAEGKTEVNGVIPAEDLVWTYIPAGDDAQKDTLYTGVVDEAGKKLTLSDSNSDAAADIVFANGESGRINVTVEAHTLDAGQGMTVTVDHNAPGANDATKAQDPGTVEDADQVVAVSEVNVDATGHVSSYKVNTYKIPTYDLKDDADASATGDVASVVTTLTDSKGTPNMTSTFKIDASGNDNLKVTASGNTVTMTLEWGEF